MIVGRTELPSANALGLTDLEHHAVLTSTMDRAHELAAAGAPGGALIVADRQQHGRGRGGKAWMSEEHGGLWMTLVERPVEPSGVAVLALRLGMALADGLAAYADHAVRVKWPNDVYAGAGKLAGVLVEARWRDVSVDWIAIGVGINMQLPSGVSQASAVRSSVTRSMLLTALVPRMRHAAAKSGTLDAQELAAWYERDYARGRQIISPVRGRVLGIAADGALQVDCGDGQGVTTARSGSLVFSEA